MKGCDGNILNFSYHTMKFHNCPRTTCHVLSVFDGTFQFAIGLVQCDIFYIFFTQCTLFKHQKIFISFYLVTFLCTKYFHCIFYVELFLLANWALLILLTIIDINFFIVRLDLLMPSEAEGTSRNRFHPCSSQCLPKQRAKLVSYAGFLRNI